MDDKRLEELLCESWTPEPPNGMKERVLRRSRQELTDRHPVRPPQRWKLVLATLGVFLVLLANLSDCAVQSRIAIMVDGNSAGMTRQLGPDSLLRQRRDMAALFVQLPPCLPKGVDPL